MRHTSEVRPTYVSKEFNMQTCRACNQPLREGATFCGECGTPVQYQPAAPAPPPSNRRLLYVVGGLGGLIVICLCLIVVVALVDPFNIIGRLTGRYDPIAQAMPPTTQLYVGINPLGANPTQWQEIAQAFETSANNTEAEVVQDDVQDEIDFVQDDLGIDFATDIAPWVGQYYGGGILDMRLDDFGEIESMSWVIALETRDRDESDAFLLRLTQDLEDEGYTDRFSQLDFQGITIYESDSPSDFDQLAFARHDNLVFMSNGFEGIRDAITAQEGDSLADMAAYEDVLSALPRQRVLTFYADPVQLGDSLPRGFVEIDPDDLPTASLRGIGFSAGLADEGFRLDMATAYDTARLTETQMALFSATDERIQIDEQLPSGTLAYWRGVRLDLTWQLLRTALDDSIGRSDIDESLDFLADELGFHPEDLALLLDGEWAVAAVPSSDGLLADELNVDINYVAIAGTSDRDSLGRLAEDFSRELEREGLDVDMSPAGNNGTLYYINDPFSPFAFATHADTLLVSGSDRDINDILSGQPSLTDDDIYRQTWRAFPRGASPIAYLNIADTIDTIRRGLTGFERDEFEASTDWLEPLTTLGYSVDNGRNHTRLYTLIVGIDTATP